MDLQISGISVDVSKFEKNIEFVELLSFGVQNSIRRDTRTVKILRETFVLPMRLPRGSPLSLRLMYKKLFAKSFVRNVAEVLNFDMEEAFLKYGEYGQAIIIMVITTMFVSLTYFLYHTEYHKSLNGISIVINLVWDTSIEQVDRSAISGPESLDDIYKICPRFRILVVGKTGVGKSSLVNCTSGTEQANVSDDRPGKANIDTEFISKQNDKFILHDSEGFEPAEENNLNVVKEFIERRRNTKDLKDRLHAVWLCCEVPSAGGRLLEKGTECILSLKKDGVLGDLPVIVVFTKYDRLIDRVDRTLDDHDLTDDNINEVIMQKADAHLQEMCTKPFERLAGSEILCATVSKSEKHKDMITQLIQMTEDLVHQYVANKVSVMTSQLKGKTSIGVGKRNMMN